MLKRRREFWRKLRRKCKSRDGLWPRRGSERQHSKLKCR